PSHPPRLGRWTVGLGPGSGPRPQHGPEHAHHRGCAERLLRHPVQRGSEGVIVGLRHARVDNPGNLIYARLPGFHLSERGGDEAAALAGILGSAPVSAVYSSPLDRAIETARALAAPHGLEVLPDDRLLEW